VSGRGDSALTLAFLQAHPMQAARVLEALPAAEAAAVFERAPARVCAGVLAAMRVREARACLSQVTDGRVLELLGPLSTPATVALLRGLPPERRQRLLVGLPTATAVASTLLLGYTEDRLGAWADPDPLALPAQTGVADALARLRACETEPVQLFVTGPQQRLSGVVTLGALCRASSQATLASLMQPPAAVLPAQSSLPGVAAHPAWARALALPVVDAADRLVGVLTLEALNLALQRQVAEAPAQTQVGVPAWLAKAYWQGLSGLLAASLSLWPRVSAVTGDRDER
jgi:magnesium transporter